MDYLSLEVSKGGFENVLVITDHFTRYAQAIPTRNQTARTTAKALFDHFIVHYGFPEKLHSDRGANFMSKVIRRLCRIAGVKQTRTTAYHPQGNGQCERFNRTLLKMLGTLPTGRKSDWKSAIPSLVHAYNATLHESTGYSPYQLMFGRPPRLAIDAVLGLNRQRISGSSPADYMKRLETNLQEAYREANRAASKSGQKAKRHYDRKVREAKLLPGDRVLVKNLGLKGKNKLADIWSEHVYVIQEQPDSTIPVFRVRREDGKGDVKALHRNHLLPMQHLPIPASDSSMDGDIAQEVSGETGVLAVESDSSIRQTDTSDTDSSSVYRPPHRRRPGEAGLLPRRSKRTRRPPSWQRGGEFVMQQQLSEVELPANTQIIYL